MLYVVVLVRGVTHLDNIMYVVCGGSSTIRLYNTDSQSPLNVINVKGMKDPQDIVVCRDDRQLYIADWRCIWRVSVVREVADDWAIPLPVAVTDVTSTAGDVIVASALVQHDQQTTTTCCLNATVHVATVPRRWDNTWYVCRWSPRHIRGRVLIV